MISLDWKERLKQDCADFLERKVPKNDFDFDIIYNAYPERVDNKIPRDVVVFVADTLASKMLKKHSEYQAFLDYLWKRKGENGRVAFACIMAKFIKKDPKFYFEYAKKYVNTLDNAVEIYQMIDKIYLPMLKKHPVENIDAIITWLREGRDLVNNHLLKVVLRIGKDDTDFLKKFTDKLENRWLGADPEFIKISGAFLKHLGKIDSERYLSFYKNYKSTREPVFVEILTLGLMMYDDFLLEIYENWSKSGNARLKKSALTGLKFLKKKKK